MRNPRCKDCKWGKGVAESIDGQAYVEYLCENPIIKRYWEGVIGMPVASFSLALERDCKQWEKKRERKPYRKPEPTAKLFG